MFTPNKHSDKSIIDQLQIAYATRLELQYVREKNKKLEKELDEARKEKEAAVTAVTVLSKEVSALKQEIERLQEQLKLGQHARFGKKSEKSPGEPIVEPTDENSIEIKSIFVTAHTRKQKTKGRVIDTSKLARYTIIHDIPEGDRKCSGCQGDLERAGEESSEQVEIMPMLLYLAVHVRYKYCCRRCETIQMSPKDAAPIPKAMAGSSLLTETILDKYQYHIPVYRQSKILKSLGANIPDNTIGSWVMQLGEALWPVYEALFEWILARFYLQVDETPVKMLDPDKKGYMWTYYAPGVPGGEGFEEEAGVGSTQGGAVIFEMSETRSGSVAQERLKDFKGLLQTDAYGGYTKLRERDRGTGTKNTKDQDPSQQEKDGSEKSGILVGLGCLTHARRRFDEVLKITNNTEGIAAEAITQLKPLYALEARMRGRNDNIKIRKRLRQKIAWPILKDFKRWLKEIEPKVPPKSKLGEAFNYIFTQWPYLIMYLRHGIAEIDTNDVENLIRAIALGKRNWLFVGHKDSGMIHALFYSLIQTCILNELNPRVYIHYLIKQVHNIRMNKVDPMTLLPHLIDKKALEEFALAEIERSKKILGALEPAKA